ncbi:MAG: hypothetical protein HZA93_03775 [Verrucomicrobia bacterium]|nr:hypothetical protein [Verrucomicrobiota bacterium]
MKRLTAIGLGVVLLLMVGGGVVVWRWPHASAPGERAVQPGAGPAPSPGAEKPTAPSTRTRAPVTGLSAAEKAARVAQIKRDYDEVRAKAAADYAAAGMAFPGGISAFLRQLALLERELHADYATVLTPLELEDLEMRETAAGQQVQKLLGDTAATEEQRREAFRRQREFDDRFALTFDTAPATLLVRETERQATQEKIREVLGDKLFAAWLRGEGGDFTNFAAFTAQQGLPAGAALELWRAKNDYTLRRLELNAQRTLTPEQSRIAYNVLAEQIRARLLGILGPGGLQAAGPDVLGWLPRGK